MNYRRFLVRLLTLLGGSYFFLRFVLPERVAGFEFGRYHQELSQGFVLIGAMAVGLGLINLLMLHGAKVAFRRKGWFNSCALLFGLFLMIFVTGSDWSATRRISADVEYLSMLGEFAERIKLDFESGRRDVPPFFERNKALKDASSASLQRVRDDLSWAENRLSHDQASRFSSLAAAAAELARQIADCARVVPRIELEPSGSAPSFSANQELKQSLSAMAVSLRVVREARYEESGTKKVYALLNEGLFIPLGSAMFSLLGFYIAAAAYRAFRVRSAESAAMMAAALLVMLGQIPFGIWLWHGFPDLRLWLLQVPNAAGARAIEIGAAVAGLVMAFRMWFSIETESFK